MVRDPVQSLEAPLLPSSATAMRPLRVGMIGIGTVGAGTFRVLARNQALIAARAGRGIKLVVVCARSLARAMNVVGKDVALTNDPMQVATHPDVDVLVEFDPEHVPGLEFYTWQVELEAIFRRPVDLTTPNALSKYIKRRVMDTAEIIYERAG